MPAARSHSTTSDHEPMGIVIADGGSPETETRFLAYVWGPVPDDEEMPVDESEELAVLTA